MEGITPKTCSCTTYVFLITQTYMFLIFQTIKRADTSKTLLQAVKGEKSHIEEKLNQEELQSSRLKQELANVETKNVELTKASWIVFIELCRKCDAFFFHFTIRSYVSTYFLCMGYNFPFKFIWYLRLNCMQFRKIFIKAMYDVPQWNLLL